MNILRELADFDRMDANKNKPQGNETQIPDQEMDQQNDVGDVGQDQEQNDDQEQMAVASQNQDPDRQGLIRTVKGARLIFKRESEEGGFDELWIYNVGSLKDGMKIRHAILAGTDIPPNATSSPDGTQEYDLWTAGNAELLHISGLPN